MSVKEPALCPRYVSVNLFQPKIDEKQSIFKCKFETFETCTFNRKDFSKSKSYKFKLIYNSEELKWGYEFSYSVHRQNCQTLKTSIWFSL